MKLIYPNNLDTVGEPLETASGFPAANLLTSHLLEGFKATSTGAPVTLEFQINGPSSALALFGVDADQITVNLYSDAGRTALHHQEVWNGLGINEFGQFKKNVLWTEYAEAPAIWGEAVFLCQSQATVKAGVLCVGPLHSFPNPSWGFDESGVDHSIRKRLKTGATYTKPKTIAYTGQGAVEFFHQTDRAKFEAFRWFRKTIGPEPFACLPLEIIGEAHWVSINGFKAVEGTRSHSTVTLTLEEYL